jgi:hypothetical protein
MKPDDMADYRENSPFSSLWLPGGGDFETIHVNQAQTLIEAQSII